MKICTILICIFSLSFLNRINAYSLSAAQAKKIGQQIWMNEGGGKIEKLTWWNEGEHFASMGIGHFIWYPQGAHKPFSESFPQLITFLAQHHKKIPACLRGDKKFHCPWKTREEFFAASTSKDMKELRQFLADTIDLQTKFIVARLKWALPLMLSKLEEKQKHHVRQQFYRIAQNAMGFYALIDYVNFKGEGIEENEHRKEYNGHSWGLLQVLLAMQGKTAGKQALEEFSTTAFALLTKRVENAPKGKNEARWLPGWKNRLMTYTTIH